MSTMNIDQELDSLCLNRPSPRSTPKKALTAMQSGQLLKVVSTDKGSLRDFAAFSKQTGNELMSQETVGEDFVHVLKRR
jgi:TusA-related sulfurtransferase